MCENEEIKIIRQQALPGTFRSLHVLFAEVEYCRKVFKFHWELAEWLAPIVGKT